MIYVYILRMKIRNREGNQYTIPYPLQQQQQQHHTIPSNNDIHHSMDLYLTVMKRLSRAFGTILQSSPLSPSPPSSTNTNEEGKREEDITNKSYWKHDKPLPIKFWKTTMKRGFEYPPSATMYTTTTFSLDDDDDDGDIGNMSKKQSSGSSTHTSTTTHDYDGSKHNHDGVTNSKENPLPRLKSSNFNNNNNSNERRTMRRSSRFGQWTNPPIVELFPGNGMIETMNSNGGDDDDDDNNNNNLNHEQMRGPSFVRVTIQGIPSSFWNHEEETRYTREELQVGHHNHDGDDRKNNEGRSGEDSDGKLVGSDGAGSTSSLRMSSEKKKTAVLRDDMVPISLVFEACFHGRSNK